MLRWDRELAGRLISKHRVTHWICIPTMIIDLFASPSYKSFDLSSLRYVSGGGAAMPHAVAERLRDEFGLTFVEGYGLTETAAPSHSNPPERAKLQCLGIPYFGCDSRVVDPVVVLRSEAKGKTSEQDIIDWARNHMAEYKAPRIVEFVASLPKSGAGKVMWRLQDQEASRTTA